MFVGLAKKCNGPNALNDIFLSRAGSVDKDDYLALLTLYLQVFHPSRANEASTYVTKYKVFALSHYFLHGVPRNCISP